MKMRTLSIAFSISLLAYSGALSGSDLTNEALFHRCYAHMTQKSSYENPNLRNQVINGQVSPIDACLQVLDSATLNTSSGRSSVNTNDAEALNVIRSMNDLHRTWFSKKDNTLGEERFYFMKDFVDGSNPALYFTKALLDSSTPIDYVITTTDNLEAVRSNQSPTLGPYTDSQKSEHMFGNNALFAPRGTLHGMLVTGSRIMTNQTNSNTVDIGQNWGGGFLGTHAYLVANTDINGTDYRANGAITMPRKWGRSLYYDVMCRPLPVIRESDASQFVVPNGTGVPAFRNAVTCARCHASMDRAASVIRNYRPNYNWEGGHNTSFAGMWSVTQGLNTAWPSTPLANYHRMPPHGYVYFRSYDGTLVNDQVNGLTELGTNLASQKDFYACVAKRYYQYFTGIDVDLGDIADPGFGRTLGPGELFHRNRVITFGEQLMSHKNPRQLIESIIRLPEYATSNYGL